MESLQIKQVTYATESPAINQIRIKVFQQEQNIAADLEFDGLDSEAIHFLAYWQDRAVGTTRMRSLNSHTYKIERLAVLPQARRQGIGHKLMEQAIATAIDQNKSVLVVHAQAYICQLYQKLGFQPVGKPFWEAGIAHQKLLKILPN